jgi:predicted SAM-dependent methyltransferase
MKSLASWLDRVGVGDLLRPAVRCVREQRQILSRRRHSRRAHQEIKQYLANASRPRLQLGASDKALDGWLNSDIDPLAGSIFLDAGKTFPFADKVFDYVFCEHFIEHLSYEQGTVCVAEAYRCLKAGGVFRLATPDLLQYVELFHRKLRPEGAEFLRNAAAFYKIERLNACVAINHLFYNWGHQFLYTESELTELLAAHGFANIVRRSPGQSDHELLQGIESHERFYGEAMNEYETMVLEAQKPGQ